MCSWLATFGHCNDDGGGFFFGLQHTDYGAGVLSFCMRCWGFLIYSFYELMCMRILSRCAGPKPEPQRHSPVESILAWGAR